VLQFLFDVLVFQSTFNSQQIVGMLMVFGINGVKWVISLREIANRKLAADLQKANK
jgi:hypothetical protein